MKNPRIRIRKEAWAVLSKQGRGIDKVNCFVNCPYCESLSSVLGIFAKKHEAQAFADEMFPKREIKKIFIEVELDKNFNL